MKNILVPTDFTPGSLQAVARLAETFPDKSFSIVLFHPFMMPDGISELLYLQKTIPVASMFSDTLRAECRRLKNQYGSVIRSIMFKPVYGNDHRALQPVIEADEIDTLLFDEHYAYTKAHKYSHDIKKYIKKCSVTVIKTEMLKKKKPVQEAAFREIVI